MQIKILARLCNKIRIQHKKINTYLMVEDTASVAALYRSYLTPLGIDINIVGHRT